MMASREYYFIKLKIMLLIFVICIMSVKLQNKRAQHLIVDSIGVLNANHFDRLVDSFFYPHR